MSTSMHVILARDLANLGKVGEVVKVRSGYARNYLFPRRCALPVSPSKIEDFEHRKRLIEHQKQKLRTASEIFRDELKKVQITIQAKSGEQGKLFGSVGSRDIEEAAATLGYAINHRDIKLEAPLKTIGSHTVEVRLEADVKAMLNVMVVPEVIEEVVAKSEEDLSDEEIVEQEIKAFEDGTDLE